MCASQWCYLSLESQAEDIAGYCSQSSNPGLPLQTEAPIVLPIDVNIFSPFPERDDHLPCSTSGAGLYPEPHGVVLDLPACNEAAQLIPAQAMPTQLIPATRPSNSLQRKSFQRNSLQHSSFQHDVLSTNHSSTTHYRTIRLSTTHFSALQLSCNATKACKA